jgi:GDPmannose 4,6-dehydratase
MKALILGSAGQDGHYLAQQCRGRGMEVIGASRSAATVCDVSSWSCVEELVRQHRPDLLFHVAGTSTTSHDAVFENHQAIATGAVNVLEAVERHSPETKVFITGSGLQFRNDGTPISENQPFHAGSSYALARIHSVYAARYYRERGVRAYVGYLFHHESPLRKKAHVSQKVAQAVKRIAGGSREVLELGDLDVEKEWTFAGEVVAGILTLLDQDTVMEAVIGSGRAHSIRSWVELCFGWFDLDWRKYVRSVDGFKCEYPRLVSDPALIRSLGWSSELDLTDLCRLMLQSPS